jgi:hypothetical protein
MKANEGANPNAAVAIIPGSTPSKKVVPDPANSAT